MYFYRLISDNIFIFHQIFDISKIQLVVCYQCRNLIGWASTRLYVKAD